jgi:hypothetical protein
MLKLPAGLSYQDNGRIIRKVAGYSNLDALCFVKRLCQHFIRHPDPTVVPVLDFQDLGWQIDTDNFFGFYMYSYDMLALQDLSDHEKILIDKVKDHWFMDKEFPADAKTESILMGWHNHPELMTFLQSTMELGRYLDLHSGNIMADQDGHYRLIDIEGFLTYPLNDPKHVWISHDTQ